MSKNQPSFPSRLLSSQLNIIISEKKDGNFCYKYQSKKQVNKNRISFYLRHHLNSKNIFEMNQIHGSHVKIITPSLTSKNSTHIFKSTDGLITNLPGIYLMVKIADCLPVIFFDPIKKVLAVNHIGWRGAAQKIHLVTLLKMIDQFSSRPENILVGFGPGIGSCCYQISQPIQNHLPEWQDFIIIKKNNQKYLDLKGFIKASLHDAGIAKKHLFRTNLCTACNNQYYSYYKLKQTHKTPQCFSLLVAIKNQDENHF